MRGRGRGGFGGKGRGQGQPPQCTLPLSEHICLKVVNPVGAEVFFRIKHDSLLKDLMDAFCLHQGVAKDSVQFYYHGQPLDAAKAPKDYEMKEDDMINAKLNTTSAFLSSSSPSSEFQLVVKTLTGKSVTLNCTQNDTVNMVKTKIYLKEGICEEQQRLIFNGKQLCDLGTTKLTALGIGQNSVIHLVLKLRVSPAQTRSCPQLSAPTGEFSSPQHSGAATTTTTTYVPPSQHVVKPLADHTTPRIMVWPGKVNQHFDLKTQQWETDFDGTSGANLPLLDYARKWYPQTLRIVSYKNETITTWRAAGNTGAFTSTKMSYRCLQPGEVQFTSVSPSTGANPDTKLDLPPNLDQIVQRYLRESPEFQRFIDERFAQSVTDWSRMPSNQKLGGYGPHLSAGKQPFQVPPVFRCSQGVINKTESQPPPIAQELLQSFHWKFSNHPLMSTVLNSQAIGMFQYLLQQLGILTNHSNNPPETIHLVYFLESIFHLIVMQSFNMLTPKMIKKTKGLRRPGISVKLDAITAAMELVLGPLRIKKSEEKEEGKASTVCVNSKNSPWHEKKQYRGLVDHVCTIEDRVHLYESEDGQLFDACLNQTNIGSNNNKFYRLQVLESNEDGEKGVQYWTWFRWGRVGENGQNVLQAHHGNLTAALREFEGKFEAKTGNPWGPTSQSQPPKPGKYVMLSLPESNNAGTAPTALSSNCFQQSSVTTTSTFQSSATPAANHNDNSINCTFIHALREAASLQPLQPPRRYRRNRWFSGDILSGYINCCICNWKASYEKSIVTPSQDPSIIDAFKRVAFHKDYVFHLTQVLKAVVETWKSSSSLGQNTIEELFGNMNQHADEVKDFCSHITKLMEKYLATSELLERGAASDSPSKTSSVIHPIMAFVDVEGSKKGNRKGEKKSGLKWHQETATTSKGKIFPLGKMKACILETFSEVLIQRPPSSSRKKGVFKLQRPASLLLHEALESHLLQFLAPPKTDLSSLIPSKSQLSDLAKKSVTNDLPKNVSAATSAPSSSSFAPNNDDDLKKKALPHQQCPRALIGLRGFKQTLFTPTTIPFPTWWPSVSSVTEPNAPSELPSDFWFIEDDKVKSVKGRIWNPFRCKIAAAVIGGLEKCNFELGQEILFIGLGQSGEVSVQAFSDLVGPTGAIYVVDSDDKRIADFNNEMNRQGRRNVKTICAQPSDPSYYKPPVPEVNWVIVHSWNGDTQNNGNSSPPGEILLKNAKAFLPNNYAGFVMLCLEVSKGLEPPEAYFASQVEEMKKDNFLKPLEQITLEPFWESCAVIVGVKKKPEK